MKALWDMRGEMVVNPTYEAFGMFGTASTIDLTQPFWGTADPQLPAGAVRGSREPQREHHPGHAVDDQQGVLRLHDRLRSCLRTGGTLRQVPGQHAPEELETGREGAPVRRGRGHWEPTPVSAISMRC
ncbi:MAG: hypothetical protein Ct9H300mP1_02060 [Planctomycetaceae bacterium]|nr:MAG: hypothetical protein Ct9H300mP1_02060 [Planctomycetaceae bacterium]